MQAQLFCIQPINQYFQKGVLPPPNKIGVYIERMEREGVARVKMFLVITVAYLIFWGPLFLVTLLNWSWEWKDAKKSMSHEVILKNFERQMSIQLFYVNQSMHVHYCIHLNCLIFFIQILYFFFNPISAGI